MDAAARIEGLEAENERLRVRIADLEAAMGMDFVAPLEWGLTGAQTRVFGVLMAREVATKDALMAGIYADVTRDAAEAKIVDVFVCHIRRKLKPFGFSVETLWGRGYFLKPETKAAVRERLAEGILA